MISLLVAGAISRPVLATENGFGKRTALADFRHSGAAQGVRAIADSRQRYCRRRQAGAATKTRSCSSPPAAC